MADLFGLSGYNSDNDKGEAAGSSSSEEGSDNSRCAGWQRTCSKCMGSWGMLHGAMQHVTSCMAGAKATNGSMHHMLLHTNKL